MGIELEKIGVLWGRNWGLEFSFPHPLDDLDIIVRRGSSLFGSNLGLFGNVSKYQLS
jgi:hypothetical protein